MLLAQTEAVPAAKKRRIQVAQEPAAQGREQFECESDCGFKGTFAEVEAHEATCAKLHGTNGSPVGEQRLGAARAAAAAARAAANACEVAEESMDAAEDAVDEAMDAAEGS